MRLWILLLLLPVGAQVSDTVGAEPELDWMRDAIEGSNIRDCIATVTQSYRVMGTPTHDLFLQEYSSVFALLGLASAVQHFDEGGPQGLDTGGDNIIGVLPGHDKEKWVVIGGHYDTRELTPGGGALDNAAGMCTTLEFARLAKQYTDTHGPLEATLIFIWYDGEEWGLHGAQAFAADPSVAMALLSVSRYDVLVTQSFDMPGLNYPAKNVWLQYGNQTDVDEFAVLNLRTSPTNASKEWRCWSYGCYEDLKQREDFPAILHNFSMYQALVANVAYDYLHLPPKYVWVYDDEYGRSDHIPLIAAGNPGMRIQGSHDEEYPCYHQPCDTLPGLYALAGGEALFLAGLETQAQVGILVAFWVTLQGDYELAPPDAGVATPGLSLYVTLTAVAMIGLWRQSGGGRP